MEEEELCVVCFRTVDIYSIGECDHPVCFNCSTRMRVLIGRNECTICRKDMAQVIFTKTVQPFSSIQTRSMQYERRYAIYFETEKIMAAYDTLLQHSCSICNKKPVYRNFELLKEHMRKEHEVHYCDLCVDHLRIFTCERRPYTRPELAQHRRKGDTDDKSHKGHPLCEFCDSRFMDNDELFRHLRRDHYFCHFCDADGTHQYYDDYNALRKHFRSNHFLCEEGDCKEEKFTSVFRTKLDLQAHCAQTHIQNLSKHAARQARTVDIEFTVNHRPDRFEERGGFRGGRGGRGRGGGRRDFNYDTMEDSADGAISSVPQSIDINCSQDFPSLNGLGTALSTGGDGGTKSLANKLAQQNRFTVRSVRGGRQLNEEEFPSLASLSAGNNLMSANSERPSTTSVRLQFNAAGNTGAGNTTSAGHPGKVVSINYSRGANVSGNSQPQNTVLKPRIGAVSHSGNITLSSASSLAEDFPSLSLSSHVPNAAPNWRAAGPMPPAKALRRPVVETKLKSFVSGDFPNLPNNKPMKSYQGTNSVKIPIGGNAWTGSGVACASTDSSSLQNEKKGMKTGKGNQAEKVSLVLEKPCNIATNLPGKKLPEKKKPPGLHRPFDLDEEEMDFSAGKLGEYESVAPVTRASNLNIITSKDNWDDGLTNGRKKSELKIGTLMTPVAAVSFDDGDFPSLHSERPGKKKGGKPKVPPGFAPATDFTFTNSAGKAFPIPSSKQSTSTTPVLFASFSFPVNFEERNSRLIGSIQDKCESDMSKLERFKQLASSLRAGMLNGGEYYVRCKEVLGNGPFLAVLPELLVLLPDIKKQQEILEAYRQLDGGRGCAATFATCPSCQQVLRDVDFSFHMHTHSVGDEVNFPSLASVSAVVLG